jgi:hypothetical protein
MKKQAAVAKGRAIGSKKTAKKRATVAKSRS